MFGAMNQIWVSHPKGKADRDPNDLGLVDG